MRRMLASLVWAVALAAGTAHADVDYWRHLGGLGLVRALAVDPLDADVMYAARSNAETHFEELSGPSAGGVWKSTDGGVHWQETNLGLTSLKTTSLAVDPSNPSTIYVGTIGGGIFRSTNGGLVWLPHGMGLPNQDVNALTIDPATPTTLYAGLKRGGAARSLDGGATWTAGSGIVGATVWQIAISPTTPSTLYAATSLGVARSTDGGASWQATGALIRPQSKLMESERVFDVRSVAVDRANPSTVLAGAWEAAGVFKSTNGGTSWTHSSTGLRGHYDNWRVVNVIAQDPVTPSTFYLATSHHTFRSLDGGDTWVVFDAGQARTESYALTTQSSVGGVWINNVWGSVHRLDRRPSTADHFRCFGAKGRGVAPRTVTVTDAHASSEGNTILKPYRFCTPTSLSGEPIADATTHLLCYKLRPRPFAPVDQPFLSQRLDGYRAYQVTKPETLCVPATVAGGPPAGARNAYRCIRGARYHNDTLDVTFTDDFGTQEARRTTTDRLCYPAAVDGVPALETDVVLRCDKLLGIRPQAAPATVTVEDRFGAVTLQLKKADSHCVPALTSRD